MRLQLAVEGAGERSVQQHGRPHDDVGDGRPDQQPGEAEPPHAQAQQGRCTGKACLVRNVNASRLQSFWRQLVARLGLI